MARVRSQAVVAAALTLVCSWVHALHAEPSREPDLLAVIRSETPEAEKALAFKGLAVHGSAACVGDVAAYLANERLSSWARITLEAIPGAEASTALRAAAAPGTAVGSRQLVGVINSLGVRRDAAAVPLLVARLGDGDPNVAAAAAAALGTIGSAEAATALVAALGSGKPDRDTVAEACVVCGERRIEAGDTSAAVGLFDAVRKADVSEQRRAEAWRAANSRDVKRPMLKAVGGSGPLRDDRAALVIDLLADRSAGGAAAAVQQALLESAAAGEPVVRLAAIRAVGRCGDATAAARLLEVAETGAGPTVAAARQAVAGMTADGVDETIVARLDTTTALPLVVGLIGDRRILTASAKVRPLADHADPAVRSAALAALGSIVSLADLGILVRRAAAPRDEAEAGVAAAALKEAAVRMPDRDGCARAIAEGLGSAGDRAVVLLETLGDVGGTKALATVATAASSGDQALQDAATRVLGKWMTADAAPVLFELATTDKAGPYRGRALKGYVRIARQFALPEAERAEMCRKALAAADDPADRKGVIEILVRYPHAATLAVAREAVALPDVAAEAKAAVATIEAKLATPADAK